MNQRNQIVDIALSQVGYVEGDNNENKYGEWYGMDNEPWCDIFVSWCAYMCGISEDVIPKEAYVPTTANWFDERKLYKNSRRWGGDYIPQKGDLILFDYDETSISDHIGIIISVNGEKIRTVEGNKDNMVKECEYNLNDRTIRAYCTPQYIDVPQPKPVYIYSFKNKNSRTPIYADLFLKQEIGYLDANEECGAFGIIDNCACVIYEIDKNDHNWKVGFTDYKEGVR